MRCIYCGYEDSKVLDSRPADDNYAIRRRRECLRCGRRFTTYERVEDVPLVVVKKSGNRDLFDRNKLLTGLLKACEKREISLETLENAASEIERELLNEPEREISTGRIGEMVMDKLQSIDPVAYVRFASVYREFKDVETFKKEIENLLDRKGDKPDER